MPDETPNEIPEMSMTGKSNRGVPLSLVWLVPLFAVGIALFIAWQTYAARGPVIKVSFAEATGVIAGQTVLKYRSLNVGMVEEMTFSDDLSAVIAHIRVDKDIAKYLDADTEFWIVQPEVSARGVSGLDTVLSGSYIQGSWDTDIGTPQNTFIGKENAPLAPPDKKGIVIRLRAEQGGRIQDGAPVVYRGVTVGEIDTPKLALDGTGVTAHAFINAPYDKLVNSNSRFWGSGGFSVAVGPSGLSLNVANLASIIQGGVTFESVVTGGRAIETGHMFTVFTDKETAEKSVFEEVNVEALTYSTIFAGAVGGLEMGAAVVLGGVNVGQVTDIGAYIDRDNNDGGDVMLRVDFALQPRRLGLENDPEGNNLRDFISEAIAGGMHAQLANESLISSALRIELQTDPDTDQSPGALDTGSGPYPIIPSLPVDLNDLSASAEGILDRVAALPIEELIANAVNIVGGIDRLINSPGVQNAPASAVALMDSAQGKVAAFDPAPLMTALEATAIDLRSLVAEVGSEDNRALVTSSLTQLNSLMGELENSAKVLPDLINSAKNVADEAAALELQALVDHLTETVTAIQTIASGPEIQAIPGEIQGLIADARGLVASPAVLGVPDQVQEALASVQAIVDQVQSSEGVTALIASLEQLEKITNSVSATVDGLPELRTQVSALLDKADALDIETLVASANTTVASVETLIASPETQALPGDVRRLIADTRVIIGSDAVQALPADLADTLASVQTLLTQFEDSKGVDSLIAALNRVDTISADIAATTAGLPQLREQVSDLLAKVDALPIEEVVTSTDAVLQSAQTLLGSEDTAALPASLSGALDEVTLVLSDLRAGGTVENVNATLASASEAAAALAAAADTLPALTAQLNGLISDAEALMATYGSRSPFNAQSISALNDIRAAARAVTDLSRAIERNPSSLIRGR